MNIPRSNKQLQTALALALLLIVASFALFKLPFTASDLSIAPDPVEYSTAAWRLVNEGCYVHNC